MRFVQRFRQNWMPATVLAAALLFIYLATLAPGLTWANDGADGGDLITAAAVLGVAHPSGYPTYLLLARAFQLLPVGSLAFRTNLLSAMCAAAAGAAVALLVARAALTQSRLGIVAGLLAGFALGLSPLLWSQAVIAEVHALHAAFIALILLCLTLSESKPLAFGSLLLGLALGNHLTTLFVLPVWLVVAARRAGQWQWRRLGVNALWLAAGLAVYLYLPLRAAAGPPVNWGRPVEWGGFWWTVLGQPYQRLLFHAPRTELPGRVGQWALELLHQFGWPGLALAAYGLAFAPARVRWLKPATAWLAAGSLIFALGYAAPDAHLYLLPAVVCAAVWLGLGAAALLRRIAPWRGLVVGGVLALLAALAWNAALNLPALDASRDTRAEDFGRAALSLAPPNALVFADTDRDTFALWYFRFALGQRTDVAVISTRLLAYPWYRQTLRETFPELMVPESPAGDWPTALRRANPRPACVTQLDAAPALLCPR